MSGRCRCCGGDDDEEHCWSCDAFLEHRQERYDSLFDFVLGLIPDYDPAMQTALSSLISAMPFSDIRRPCRPKRVSSDQWLDCVTFDWRLANLGILPDSLQSIFALYLRAYGSIAQSMKPERQAAIIVESVRREIIYGAMHYYTARVRSLRLEYCKSRTLQEEDFVPFRHWHPKRKRDGRGSSVRTSHHRLPSVSCSKRPNRRGRPPDCYGDFVCAADQSPRLLRVRPPHFVHPWS